MTHHTPGPWRLTRDHTPGQYGINERIRDKHNSVICNLHVNAEANARLIAAAPDLLDMCQRLVGFAYHYGSTTGILAGDGMLAQAKALIAQAKGNEA